MFAEERVGHAKTSAHTQDVTMRWQPAFCLHSTMFCAGAYQRFSTSTLTILSGHKHPCLSRWAD